MCSLISTCRRYWVTEWWIVVFTLISWLNKFIHIVLRLIGPFGGVFGLNCWLLTTNCTRRRDGTHSHYRRKPKVIITNNLTYQYFTTVHVPELCKVSIHGRKRHSGLALREVDCREMADCVSVCRFCDMYHDATTHLTSEYKHMYHDRWNTVTWHLLHQGGVVNISIIDWCLIERLSAHAGAIPSNQLPGRISLLVFAAFSCLPTSN